LCLTVTGTAGQIAGCAALAVGFFNSIMFPTIFTLTLERANAPTASTSGLLCMAIVGGAILPVIVGRMADSFSVSLAFFVPAISYVVIAIFALSGSAKAKLSNA
jgi:FHS family L-fucose permease-like MFS transporter